MSNLGFSYIAIHPGEMLKEELESRGITQKEFAKAIAVSYTMLNEILNGKRSITADFAILIEAALGTPAEHWLNMQARYNLQTARSKETVISRFNSIRNMTTWFSPQKKAEVATV
jgi:addiction module HigA family antidote